MLRGAGTGNDLRTIRTQCGPTWIRRFFPLRPFIPQHDALFTRNDEKKHRHEHIFIIFIKSSMQPEIAGILESFCFVFFALPSGKIPHFFWLRKVIKASRLMSSVIHAVKALVWKITRGGFIRNCWTVVGGVEWDMARIVNCLYR